MEYDGRGSKEPGSGTNWGNVRLVGEGLVGHEKIDVEYPLCPNIDTTVEPTETIRVAFKPVFFDGRLALFDLVDFAGHGLVVTQVVQCIDSEGFTVRSRGYGLWGSLFVDARRAKVVMTPFAAAIVPPKAGLIAEHRFGGTGAIQTGISGAKIIEDTLFSLYVWDRR